jgi:hypothetical protein
MLHQRYQRKPRPLVSEVYTLKQARFDALASFFFTLQMFNVLGIIYRLLH